LEVLKNFIPSSQLVFLFRQASHSLQSAAAATITSKDSFRFMKFKGCNLKKFIQNSLKFQGHITTSNENYDTSKHKRLGQK